MSALLELHGLRVEAAERGRAPRALLGPLDLELQAGQCLGVVGESGSGKSLTALALLGLLPAPLRARGGLRVDGAELALDSPQHARLRGRTLAWVPQDPLASLHPLRRVGAQLVETLRAVLGLGGDAARQRARSLLERVQLPEPAAALTRYPHEFSGGQRQRLGIARALAMDPEIIVADEAVSALDVSVQAQVLLLLKDLQTRRGLAFVFVSHDLGVVRWFCSRVAVMYLGRIVETGSVSSVFGAPRHPYTRMLRDASPIPDPAIRGQLPRIVGEIPSAANPPAGCHFHPRCPRASDLCRTAYPEWRADGDGAVACHHPED